MQQRKLWLVIALVMVIVGTSGSGSAQDTSPVSEPLNPETPVAAGVFPELPLTTADALPDAPAATAEALPDIPAATHEIILPSETPVATPSETPTISSTPSETPSASPAPSETATATFVPSASPIIPENAAPVPDEAPLFPIFAADFETADMAAWSVGPGWGFHTTAGGQALRVYNSAAPVTFAYSDYTDVAIEAGVMVNYGTAHLFVRASSSGSYSVSLDSAGLVTLYRAGQPVGTAQVAASVPEAFRQVRLTAVGDQMAVEVDGIRVLSYSDSTPLPGGKTGFHASFAPLPADYGTAYPPMNTVMVDNVVLYQPAVLSGAPEVFTAPQSSGSVTIKSNEQLPEAAKLPPVMFLLDCDFEVSASDESGLISAINDANTAAGADVICLTNSTYTLTAVNNSSLGNNGLPRITSDITIEGNGAIIERTAASPDTSPEYRLFKVENTGILTLNDMTLRNGDTDGTWSGGAIYVNDGILNVNDVTMTANRAASGGAIFNNLGTVNINHSTFTLNRATANGGAIATNDVLNIENDSLFSNNLAQHDTNSAGSGGAIHGSTSAARINISDSTLEDNEAKVFGGAILIDGGGVVLDNVEVFSNLSYDFGGGLYISNKVAAATDSITDSLISENTSHRSGGGIFVNGSSTLLTITGSTIDDNFADEKGGGIYNTAGDVVIDETSISGNSLIDNNTNSQGAGLYLTGGSASYTVTDSVIQSNVSQYRGGGVYHASGTGAISNSCINGNTAPNAGSGVWAAASFNADGNWWGHVDGPTRTGVTAGDSITSNVTYANYLTTGCPYTPAGTPTPTYTPSITYTPSSTYTPSNTPTSTYTPSHTPTSTPTKTNTPSSIQPLQLTAQCSPNPGNFRVWVVHNPNNFTVPFEWGLDGSDQFGEDTAPELGDVTILTRVLPGEHSLYVAVSGMPDVWEDENFDLCGTVTPTYTPAPTATAAHTPLVATGLCSDNPAAFRRWRVYNPNNEPIEFTWGIDLTDQEGSGAIAANSSVIFTTIAEPPNGNPDIYNVLLVYVNDIFETYSKSVDTPCTTIPTPTPSPTLSATPANLHCYDWRNGMQTWTKSPWVVGGIDVVTNSTGLKAVYTGTPVAGDAGIYLAAPASLPAAFIFQTSGSGDYTVAQGSSAPTSGSQLSTMLLRHHDLYTLSNNYIEIRWSPGSSLVFESFCYVTGVENVPPVVDAGPDVNATSLPNPMTYPLAGSYTDDGLTTTSPTVTWSKISGPGTVTFVDAASPTTNVTFGSAGSYVLRLTVDDGEFTVSDEVIYNLAAGNQAPVVSAGFDMTIPHNASALLTGSAIDDGLPAALTYTWSKVDGPGTVNFTNGSTLNASATFSAIGVYTLRLTVSDGQLEVYDDVLITVNPPTATPLPTQTPITPTATSTPEVGCYAGKIFVNHDEWTLSNVGFGAAPDVAIFAKNLANWFTNGKSGKFLAYSNNFGLTESMVEQAMQTAGHIWDKSGTPNLPLTTLDDYDAVFVGGDGLGANTASTLISYVQGGGNVYLLAGTGVVWDAPAEAAAWNPFLNAFGLEFATAYNQVNFTLPVTSIHPVMVGVQSLYQGNGSSISELFPSSPYTAILEEYENQYGNHGLFAIYDCPQARPADLTVLGVDTSGMTTDPNTLESSGYVTALLRNAGDGDVFGPFNVIAFEDMNNNSVYNSGTDTVLSQVTHTGLAAGAEFSLQMPVSGDVTFPGNRVYVYVDSGDTIAEEREDNNYGSSSTCNVISTFNPEIKFRWGMDNFGDREVMMMPVVADLNSDGVSDIIFATYTYDNYLTGGKLRVLDGKTGELRFTREDNLHPESNLAVGDVDGDGRPEIIAHLASNSLIAYEDDGLVKSLWGNPPVPFVLTGMTITLANITGDSAPEIVAGQSVFDADGTGLWTGASSGRGIGLVANLDLTGEPEVILGNRAYSSTGTLLWTYGSTDGYTAIGNFDSDDNPEVVLVTTGNVSLWEHDSTGANVIWSAAVSGLGSGGAPTVADFDGDGEPEIGVAGSNTYTVLETNGSFKWAYAVSDWSSQQTGSSVFDFNGDGQAEVVYGDQNYLYIFQGSDGTLLWSTPSVSGTAFELPIVVDLEGDGHTEIIKVSNKHIHPSGGFSGITVYSSDDWVGTRQIWNQHAYHITNVNDDGTIPAVEEHSWLTYNSYRQNPYPTLCTTGEPDLSPSYLRKTGSGASTTLTARTGNSSFTGVASGTDVVVKFYAGDPANGGTLLETATHTTGIDPWDSVDVAVTVDPLPNPGNWIWVTVDEADTIEELNEDNNTYQSRVYLTTAENTAPSVNAGTDQTITLPTSFVVLNWTASDSDNIPPDSLTTTWGVVSGPGSVNFEPVAAGQTRAIFSASGTYVLRLIASDTQLETTDDVTVTVNPAPTPTPAPPPVPQPPSQNLPPAAIPGCMNMIMMSQGLNSPFELGTGYLRIIKPAPIIVNAALSDVRVEYWPVTRPDLYKTLVTGAAATANTAIQIPGSSPAQYVQIDPMLLANDSYTVRVVGENTSGSLVVCAMMVNVTGDNKLGRVTLTTTDLTVPVVGLPITIGRTYDSLERDYIGDFGYGWSLALGQPRVQIDARNNITLTLPDGRRVTYYYTPTGFSIFLPFGMVTYTPEPGVYGSLTVESCGLIWINSYCVDGGFYGQRITGMTYTDPYGRSFVMGVDGRLQSITDLNGNQLEFTASGIFARDESDELIAQVTFTRDGLGRITTIRDAANNVYTYEYNAIGDLVSVFMPDTALPARYVYQSGHYLQEAWDARGNRAGLITYDASGRLDTVQDASGNTTEYAYAFGTNVTTTTITQPDQGEVVRITDYQGNLKSETDALNRTTTYFYDFHNNLTATVNHLGHTTRYTYDAAGNRTSTTNPLGKTPMTLGYNAFSAPSRIDTYLSNTAASINTYTVAYSAAGMPTTLVDSMSLTPIAEFTWNERGSLLTRKDGNTTTTSYEYDSYGNLLKETLDMGSLPDRVTQYTYDTMGRQLTVTDPQGAVTRYTYDQSGRMLTVTDPKGATSFYTYDGNSNRIAVTDPVGRITRYEYDADNRLIKTVYPDGGVTTTTYDFRGSVLTQTDPMGVKTCYTYDLAGQLITLKTACGTGMEATTTYTYDGAGRQTAIVDPMNRKTCYLYDAAGRMTEMLTGLTNAQNCASAPASAAHTLYIYNDMGQRIQTVEPINYAGVGEEAVASTRYVYDKRGRLIETNFPDGTREMYFYDNAGQRTDVLDAKGIRQKTVYRIDGQVASVEAAYGTADASTITYDYDIVGRLMKTLDPRNSPTLRSYDVAGQLIGLQTGINSDKVQMLYAYDPAGQQITMTDVNQTITRYEYDLMGRPVRTTYPDFSTTQQAYDLAGRLIRSIDGNGNTTTYTYDAAGRLASVTNGEGDTVSYLYYLDGQIKEIIDGENRRTYFEYDGFGRMKKRTFAYGTSAAKTEEFLYDLNGNLIQQELSDGITLHVFWYDNMNRLERAQYIGATPAEGESWCFDYDQNGNRTLVGTPAVGSACTAVKTYNYDLLNRVLSITAAGQSAQSVTYTYDDAGNRTSVTTTAGTTTYTYDTLNRVKTVQEPGVSGDFTYVYDRLGLLDKVELPTGFTTDYTFDNRYRVRDIRHFVSVPQTPTARFAYTYDLAGNRTRAVEDVDGSDSEFAWTYDQANRLKTVTDLTGAPLLTTYTYDAAGNRDMEVTGNTTTISTYNALNQLTTQTETLGMVVQNNSAYTYDARGNLTTVAYGAGTSTPLPVANYAYNARNEMTSATASGSTITYAYDADGHRTQQSINGTVTKFVWDEFSRYDDVLVELDNSNAVTTSYVYGAMGLLSQTVSGTNRYLLTDVQNSTRVLLNTNNTVAASYAYTPFGSLTSTDPVLTKYLYTGQQYDSTTELYSLRARYYAPEQGRFLSRDTYPYDFQNPRELNRYVYAASNPVMFSDPSGLAALGENTVNYKYNTAPARRSFESYTRSILEGFVAGLGGYTIGVGIYSFLETISIDFMYHRVYGKHLDSGQFMNVWFSRIRANFSVVSLIMTGLNGAITGLYNNRAARFAAGQLEEFSGAIKARAQALLAQAFKIGKPLSEATDWAINTTYTSLIFGPYVLNAFWSSLGTSTASVLLNQVVYNPSITEFARNVAGGFGTVLANSLVNGAVSMTISYYPLSIPPIGLGTTFVRVLVSTLLETLTGLMSTAVFVGAYDVVY